MTRLVLTRVSKVYHGGTKAVDDVSIDVGEGELMVLLGPSGCGKSTILRMVAGLEDVTSGTVELGGRVLNDVAERERDIAMVFQSYALYPHMSVYGNIAYPLKHRGVRRAQRKVRVEEVARVLGLDGVLDKKPAQLSGGQRQRVAMGRAMVREPKLFLLDEPFSNLDAALRGQMRTEVHALQRRLGVGMVFVTHDQVEAMTLGDRVAVMRDGVLQQVGPPHEVYSQPANVFVAAFMGTPGMTLFPASVASDPSGGLSVRSGESVIRVDQAELAAYPKLAERAGGRVIVGVRSEDLAVANGGVTDRSMHGTLRFQEQLGSSLIGYFAVPGVTREDTPSAAVDVLAPQQPLADVSGAIVEPPRLLPGRFHASTRIAEGSQVELTVAPGALHFFDAAGGQAV
jgi:multiple sugar transport system ATP-binding protein